MSMDTPASGGESNAPLSVNQAAALFGGEPEQAQPAQAETAAVETPKETPAATQAETTTDQVEEPAQTTDETITIQVDGKDVEVKKSELPDLYKNGLRQADYTRKTMETAEQRKAAEAELSKAREERSKFSQGLQQAQALLQAQLHEQAQIDWNRLLEENPQEYLKQQHLANARQANLQRVLQQQQQISAIQQAEQAQQMQATLQTQQQELLAKLPEWKDESKAKAEREALREYLKGQGLEDMHINNITDHRLVILSRKAMLYDQMLVKAKETTKRVESAPPKVERPGGGDTNPMDGRTAAMKQLAKSGSVNDAAMAFAALRQRT